MFWIVFMFVLLFLKQSNFSFVNFSDIFGPVTQLWGCQKRKHLTALMVIVSLTSIENRLWEKWRMWSDSKRQRQTCNEKDEQWQNKIKDQETVAVLPCGFWQTKPYPLSLHFSSYHFPVRWKLWLFDRTVHNGSSTNPLSHSSSWNS